MTSNIQEIPNEAPLIITIESLDEAIAIQSLLHDIPGHLITEGAKDDAYHALYKAVGDYVTKYRMTHTDYVRKLESWIGRGLK